MGIVTMVEAMLKAIRSRREDGEGIDPEAAKAAVEEINENLPVPDEVSGRSALLAARKRMKSIDNQIDEANR